MVTLLARRADRKSNKTKPRLEALEERSLLTAAVPGVTLDPATIPKFVNPLDASALAFGNPNSSFVYQTTDTTTVKLQDGSMATVPLYHVGSFQIQADVLGLKDGNGNPILTTVYGYGTSAATASSPGPSFVIPAQQNGTPQPIAVEWTNGLTSQTLLVPVDPTVLGPNADANGKPYYSLDKTTNQVTFPTGIPVVTHVHGGHTDAAYDGTPNQWMTATGPNQQFGPDFAGLPDVSTTPSRRPRSGITTTRWASPA